MAWVLGVIAFIIIAIVIFFQIPYSKTKSEFQKDVRLYSNRDSIQIGVFTEQDIASLPEPVQKYFRVCGYIGTPKMASMTAYMPSVPFIDRGKPPMIMDYTLFFLSSEPVRLAHIKTSMYGVPFEAYDSTQNSVGFMKGVLGKTFTLFNHGGSEMDKGQLLTYLGECFLVPASILNGYITWEAIDAHHVKATISHMGISGSGIVTFDDDGFVKSFQTNERARMDTDGSIDYPLWSAVYSNYTETKGILYPESIKAVYHDDDGELVYFDASGFDISFQYAVKDNIERAQSLEL
jgi:hypothetical protein